MKILLISNYYNHHQKSLCDNLYRLLNRNFFFIETSVMREDRKALGYGIEKEDYVFSVNDLDSNVLENIEADKDGNIVIAGSAPEKLVQKYISKENLVFRYSERPLKNGFELWKYPFRFIKWHRNNTIGRPVYLLCASAYATADYKKFGLFKNKTYKWGYFPETKKYDIENLINNKNKRKILWCGRLLDWKHPEFCIEIARKLRDSQRDFSMGIIGTGELSMKLNDMIQAYQLEDKIHLLGPMKPEQVREHMEKAGIYICTSNKKEGWGAVINESMNSGCAVVASHEIGSVPFLIEDGKNGFIYESGNIDMLYEKIKYLLDNPKEQERLGKAAYKTIDEEWNAEVAAERFVNLSSHIIKGEKYPDLYKSGPCSKAEIISDKWEEKRDKGNNS